MRKISLLIFVALAFSASAQQLTSLRPSISVGLDAPAASACDRQTVGNVYVRSENSSNGPIHVLRCTQVGGLTYAWQPIGHFVGATLPTKCALGDIAFRTGVGAGSNLYGCTATDTWTAQAGGSGGGSPGGADTNVQYNDTGVFAGDSGLAYNKSTKSLGVIGSLVSGQTSTGTGSLVLNGVTSGSVTIKPNDAAGTNIVLTAPATTGTLLTTGGNAATATALAANGTNCSAGSYALGVDASGNAEGCTAANAAMVYPGAGVANSTGSAWGTSYTVGTSANNLVQLNSSALLPSGTAASTQTAGDSTTLLATTAFVSTAISALAGGHTQNTDTGTTSATFCLSTTGPCFQNIAGTMKVVTDSGGATDAPMEASAYNAPSGTPFQGSGAEQVTPISACAGVACLGFDSTLHQLIYQNAAGAVVGQTVNPAKAVYLDSFKCEAGYGDGLNAIPAGTYVQVLCHNEDAGNWTVTSAKCYSNNSGSSTLNVTNSAGVSVLNSAITCSTAWAAGTLSSSLTIVPGDYLKFTFIADGTTNNTTFSVKANR